MASVRKGFIAWFEILDGNTLVIGATDGDLGTLLRCTARDPQTRIGDPILISAPGTTTLQFDAADAANYVFILCTSGTLVYAPGSGGGGGSVSAPPASSNTSGVLRLAGALGGTSTTPTALGFASRSAFDTYIATQLASVSGGSSGTVTAVDGGTPSSNFSGTTGIDGGSP